MGWALEWDKQSSEWEVAVQIAVAKQMKRLKYCSIVLADHKRTYNNWKGENAIFSLHIEKLNRITYKIVTAGIIE